MSALRLTSVLHVKANQFPTIKAAKSFVGLGVVSSDVYTGGNGGAEEWYINQVSSTVLCPTPGLVSPEGPDAGSSP